MATASYNINYKQGANYRQQFRFYAPAGMNGASTVPVDFTGYTGKMQVREVWDDPEPMVELTTENDLITMDDEGWITLHIPVESAVNLHNDGVYDLYVTSGETGEPERLMEGLFRFSAAVTRD